MVYLIGAGPGDPGLLTLKAKECIEQANVIVYDKLANPKILSYAQPNTQMIYVGKESNRHTMKQEDINTLLVKLAQEGKTVARLKGGDPFVFGRGGEEALELVQNNIPFEIVPGVTSAIAVAAYAGIPVTHRNIAVSFAVVTGHENPDKDQSGIKWQGLAQATDTLVFLMGIENLANITKNLLAYGRSADTPAAIIRCGTHPEQKVLVTTLGNASVDVLKNNLKPPAIFIVGEVVRLREKLAWFDKNILCGKKVVVTRAREQASSLSKRLTNLGADVLEIPSIKIVPPTDYTPLDTALKNIAQYKWIIFTSVNGVKSFFQRLVAMGKDSRALASNLFAVIGSETAHELSIYGIKADVLPLEYRAEGVLEALAGKFAIGERILIPRAKVAREILPLELRKAGAEVDIVTAYETVVDMKNKELLISELNNNNIDIITFTSSSTVTNLLTALGEQKDLLKNTTIAAIGPITAETCWQNDLKVDIIANEFTIPGLVDAIKIYYEEKR